MVSKKLPLIIAALVLLVVALPPLAGIYLDFLWFKNLGFQDVFTKVLWTQIWVAFAFGLVFFVFQLVNVLIAHRKDKKNKPSPFSSQLTLRSQVLIITGISVFVGLAFRSFWEIVLLYMNQVAFRVYDPIFGLDLAFYVFSLPFFSLVVKFLLLTVGVSLVFTALVYLSRGGISWVSLSGPEELPESRQVKLSFNIDRRVKTHLSLLGSLFFVVLGAYYYLKRYSVLYSESGIITGAGYTDVNVTLPVLTFLVIFSLVIAFEFLIWPRLLKKKNIIPVTIAAFLIVAFVSLSVVPGLVQYFKVLPNEFRLEQPFIESNIEFTRLAYGLDRVEDVHFDVQPLTYDAIANNPKTFDNIRLWDHRPLRQTYSQLQTIRLYYDFLDVDIDRYTIDGNYRQVMLSVREMNQDKLTSSAQTWVNKKLVFTHGIGATLSPVNEFTAQGMPELFVKDIPPVTSYPELVITQPRIYYGEGKHDYVITNTATREFDYARGDQNVYNTYDGTGGVLVGSFWRKLLFAVRFGDMKLLLTGDISPESKVLFYRNIRDRVSRVVPFLTLDPDPYIVIHDGGLVWMQDAYTTSDNLPYSTYTRFSQFHSINYIRNSVKVVIDAYDGSLDFYITDPDPIVNAYANIFPSLFKDMKSMPSGLSSHVRYPEQFFKIQSNMYSTYHMTDANTFYNKEDLWNIPREVYGEGAQIMMEPYYVIMRLPDNDKEEFILMTPFTPHNKNNMIGWLAARSDNAMYGKLLVYKFPKEHLIYGPMQIEAKIDQDSVISEQLTLWDQRGSTVVRGNLLVVPIDNSIIYIEPLYLIADKTQLPELKRIIVSDGEKVIMEPTLKEALDKLFGTASQRVVRDSPRPSDSLYDDREDLLALAADYYDNIESSMKSGDWTGIGENLDGLGDVLSRLRGEKYEETALPVSTVDDSVDGADWVRVTGS